MSKSIFRIDSDGDIWIEDAFIVRIHEYYPEFILSSLWFKDGRFIIHTVIEYA